MCLYGFTPISMHDRIYRVSVLLVYISKILQNSTRRFIVKTKTRIKVFAYLYPIMPVMSGFVIFRSGLPYDANFEFIENPAYQYSDCIWFNEKFECPYIYKTAEQGF